MTLIIGAILGLISVAIGAYAEHGLKTHISSEHFDMLMTAIRYNQLYAILITVIGLISLTAHNIANSIFLKLSSILFTLGTLMFSFSIYCFVIFKLSQALRLAPIGGTTLMLGWGCLIVMGMLTLQRKKH